MRDGETKSKLLDIFDIAKGEAIQVIEISQKYKSLYVSTDYRIKQIALQMCNHRYDSCFRCVKDPYCGWDSTSNECKPYELGLLQVRWNFMMMNFLCVHVCGLCNKNILCVHTQSSLIIITIRIYIIIIATAVDVVVFGSVAVGLHTLIFQYSYSSFLFLPLCKHFFCLTCIYSYIHIKKLTFLPSYTHTRFCIKKTKGCCQWDKWYLWFECVKEQNHCNIWTEHTFGMFRDCAGDFARSTSGVVSSFER